VSPIRYPRESLKWTDSEEHILEIGFTRGFDVCELSRRHLRSPESIKNRLIYIGLLSPAPEPDWDHLEFKYFIAAAPGFEVENLPDEEKESGEEEEDETDRAGHHWCYSEDKECLPDPTTTHELTKEQLAMLEDWGNNFDDLGPGYWEEVLSGPDDDQIERYQEYLAEEYFESDESD